MSRSLGSGIARLMAVLIVVLAGCFGPAGAPGSVSPTETSGNASRLDETREPIPSEAPQAAGTGALQGLILNDYNTSIGDAQVSLVGTTNFTASDSQGRFGFTHVPEGTFTLRVDQKNYESLERSVTVVAGEVTRVTVHLAFRADVESGFRVHVHDNWEGLDRKVIYDEPIPWPFKLGGGNLGNELCTGGRNPNPQIPPRPCDYLQVPLRKPIPPGAVDVEVTITWKQTDALKQVNLFFRTANWSGAGKSMVMPNGVAKNFSLQKPDTDHGHAPYTGWFMIFYVDHKVGGAVSWNEGDLVREAAGDFRVKVVAVKGELWLEDPHRHFWTDGARLKLIDNLTTTLADREYDRDPRNQIWSSAGNPYFTMTNAYEDKSGILVPPGTTRLELTLRYASTNTALESQALATTTIAFRTGTVWRYQATLEDLRVEPAKSEASGLTVYHLALKPEETDNMYAKSSNWLFLLANKGRERDPKFANEWGLGAVNAVQYRLTAFAVNENYAEDFAAGRI